MTAPDQWAVRGYNATVDRHQKNAERALKSVQQHVESLSGDGLSHRVLALGEAQRLAVEVAELVTHLAANWRLLADHTRRGAVELACCRIPIRTADQERETRVNRELAKAASLLPEVTL